MEMSRVSDMVRKEFKESDEKRDSGLMTPEDIVRYDDIVYGNDEKWHLLDVYCPKQKTRENLPVIVSVHGGGWVYGNKDVYQFYCMSLAQHGFAVVNFTYRLAPEFKFPAVLEDSNKVFHWIFENSGKYGFDTDHIFAVGDSAGAHQLGLYAAICTNPNYAKKFSFQVPKGFVPTAIAFNCGAYKINITEDPNDLLSKLMGDFLENGGTEEELKAICVAEHITEKYPPVFYMTCTGDFMKIQAPILENKLLEKNIPHEFHFYGDSEHELGHVFHCNIKKQEAILCNKEECDFFKKFCV